MASTNRPSPTASATQYPAGHAMIGNDGRVWQVQVTQSGVHRWVPTSHLYGPGEKVKIIAEGYGAPAAFIGNEYTIKYVVSMSGQPYYRLKNDDSEITVHQSGVYKIISEVATPQPTTKKVNIMAKSVKSITKKTTAEVRTIETSLINKEEVFKMLALAESTGMPLLLVGDPGVAKTKTIIEYAKAWLNKDGKMTAEDFANKIYILETDEGTKASEIKGMPDLGKLFTDNKYELNTPIAEADIVIINEVDKASSAIRNAMLGVMNEKFLFNGKHKVPCKWKLFVATCNEIPKDEVDSPFWDRFILKMTVNRVSAGDISKYYAKGARDYREKFNIGVPNNQEINSIDIPFKKLDKYLEVGYNHSSDRTLTFVPKLSKAVSFVWNISIDKALVKTANIMIGQNAGSELLNKLMSPEVKAIMQKVEMLHSHQNRETLEFAVAEIEGLVNTYASRDMIDEDQISEIESTMQYILNAHPAYSTEDMPEEAESMFISEDYTTNF